MGRQQTISVTWTCDVCGKEIPESEADGASRKISWEGTQYLVDLCATHQVELSGVLDNLKVFIDAGRAESAGRTRRGAGGGSGPGSTKAGRRGAAGAVSKARSRRRDLGAIRSWARENGHQVSERGRIAGSVLSAYDEANRAEAPPDAPAPRKRASRKASIAS
ncbi:MAG: Lsr2 family protein [Actinomycetota bacterium]|nr:Lsr2 family protein [Actinomycetota bacterium]